MMTRRVFLKNGSLALVSLGFTPAFIARSAEAARAKQKILIAIFQRGAVDGLNMVVPFGERAYYEARPSIAIPAPGQEGGAIDLDGFFGLHPRMAPLEPAFKSGQLAIVHAAGSHDETRSHFDAQDYMESGTPGLKSTPDGWLGRATAALPATSATPFRSVALTSRLPRSLRGDAGALAMSSLDRFDVRAGAHLVQGHGYDQGRLKLDARNGEIYFVSLRTASGTSDFRLVAPETGKRDILRCCSLFENWAPGQRPSIY